MMAGVMVRMRLRYHDIHMQSEKLKSECFFVIFL